MLPDYVRKDLDVIFCGTAAGKRSAEAGHYYAGRGNAFWRVLYECGLTSELLDPSRDADLLDFGIGLTDLAKGVAGMDKSVGRADFDRTAFLRIVADNNPRSLAFNGKLAAKVALQKTDIRYGQYFVHGLPTIWVLPSTSGAARKHFSLQQWLEFAAWVRMNPTWSREDRE